MNWTEALLRAEFIWHDELLRSVARTLLPAELKELVRAAADHEVWAGLGRFKSRQSYLTSARREGKTIIDVVTEYLKMASVSGDLATLQRILGPLGSDSARFAELASYHNIQYSSAVALTEDLRSLTDASGRPVPWVQDAFVETELADFEHVIRGLSYVRASAENFNRLFKAIAATTNDPLRASEYVIPAISWRSSSSLVRLASAADALIAEVARHPTSIHKMSGREFELFLKSLFEGFGFSVDLTAQTRDGGVDLFCLSASFDIPIRIAVEAKRYSPHRPVSVSLVRSFVGANSQFHANKLIYVTTSRFTRDALAYAAALNTNLLMLADMDQVTKWASLYLDSC